MAYQSEDAELLALCTRAARSAADVILAAEPRRRHLDWRSKGPTDFVSDVDVASEERILEVFGKELPEAVILAEESAASVPAERLTAGLAVVIDPLDGTTNFLHGYPEYAVSIAVLRQGVPVAAVVHDVPSREVFTAHRGGGTWLNGERCEVSGNSEPQRALIGTGFPFKDSKDIAPYQEQMSRVMARVAGVRRPGAASIDLASVASGRFDAFWENSLSAWDFAAGMLLVTEAGGVVSDLDGAPLVPTGSSSVLAGGAAMHDWLRRVLAGA
jgi:myo-inositol-1(or 4)-monophosphatase